jgi:energy-coupling factor transport system ATP-binding protein
MSDAVVFEDVTFTYPEAANPALTGVSLAVPEGAFALVCGATGAGKSTLVRMVNGLVPHFSGGVMSGRVITAGRSPAEHPPRRLADVVAFVPQDAQAAFVLDRVEDELAYAMENLGVAPALMRRRVEETLDLLGIESLRGRSVRTLSGGERQRVAIAAALTAGPRVLALDEPTSQLDPQGAEDVLAALQRLVHDLGMTVLLAEHRLERVATFADLAIGCHPDGRVLAGEVPAVLEALDLGPPVTRLGRELGWRPPPLSVREARALAASLALGSPPSPDHRATDGSAPLVEACGVSAGYGAGTVLRDVELALGENETVALMGRNGAGKTTLLRCLSGLHRPAKGTIRTPRGVPRPGVDVALCPQSPDAVLFRDSVADEVAATVAARHSGLRVEEVLESLGIRQLAEAHPRDLSAGERLLVALAAIVATGAQVLFLDEPTRGLDLPTKERLAAFLSAHSAAGGAVLCATHDVELAAEIASRVIILAGGEIIADGPPGETLGDSPVFAPQMARVLGAGWLTPEQVARAAGVRA